MERGNAPVLYKNKERTSAIQCIENFANYTEQKEGSEERLQSDFKQRNYLRQPNDSVEKSDSNIAERRNLTDQVAQHVKFNQSETATHADQYADKEQVYNSPRKQNKDTLHWRRGASEMQDHLQGDKSWKYNNSIDHFETENMRI